MYQTVGDRSYDIMATRVLSVPIVTRDSSCVANAVIAAKWRTPVLLASNMNTRSVVLAT